MPLNYTEFAKKIKQKYPAYKDADDLELAKKMVEKYPEYKDQVSFDVVKKKDPSVSPSNGVKPTTSSVTKGKGTQPSSGSSASKENTNIFTGFPGKEQKKYRFDDSSGRPTWYEYSATVVKNGKQQEIYDKPIHQPERIDALNKHFKKNIQEEKPSGAKAKYADVTEGVYTGFPGKEQNEYRVIGNNWQRKEPNKDWVTVKDSNAIIGLNKQFKKKITPNEEFEGISSKLIANSEETVVPYLQRNYGNLGFVFEESKAGSDRVTVRTEDGTNSETFFLDNFTTSGDSEEAIRLKAWLKQNVKTIDSERYAALDQEIRDIKNVKPSKKTDFTNDAFEGQKAGIPADLSLDIKQQLQLKEKEKEAIDYNKGRMNSLLSELSKAKALEGSDDDKLARAKVAAVYGNKDELAKQNRYINNELTDIARVNTDLKRRKEELARDIDAFNTEVESAGGVFTEDLEAKKSELEGRSEMIDKTYSDLETNISASKRNNYKLEIMSAEYMLQKESQGSTGGGIVNSFLKGATTIGRLAGMSKDDQRQLIESIGSAYTTEEFTKSKDRSSIEKVLFSLSESLGAAAVGGVAGKVGSSASFFSQSYYEVKDEMNSNPDFASVPEQEKDLLAVVYGVSMGFLEKFGVDTILSKTPISKTLVNKILTSSIKGLPKGAPIELVEEAVNSNMKALIAKGAIQVVGGSLVEGSTEFAQELTGGGIKELYNEIKDKELFDTPDDILGQGFEAAWMGALGGAIMQTPVQAVSAISTGLSKKNSTMIDILEKSVSDSEVRSMIVSNIKTQIVNNQITKEEGQAQIEAINSAASVFSKIPDNVSDISRAKSFDLLIERSKIEKEIEGKDPALVDIQKARITEINEELKTISNATKEDKQPIKEDTAKGSVSEYQGTDEGQQKVGTTEGSIGKTEKPEADRGDSFVASKEKVVANSAPEVDRLKSVATDVEDGVTLNLDGTKYEDGGLVVPVASKNVTSEELTPEMISDFIEENAGKIGDTNSVKVGLYKFPNSNQVSIDLNVIAPESSREAAVEFGKLADQESLFDLSTFENVKTGGTGMNPAQFTDEQFKEISKALSEGRVPNVFAPQAEVTNENSADVVNRIAQETGDDRQIAIAKAARSVVKALPGVKIFLYKDTSAYRKALADKEGKTKEQLDVEESDGASSGSYIDGEIHIDLSVANNATLYHEAFHHAFAQKGISSGAAKEMATGLKKVVSDKALIAQIEEFENKYDTDEQAEEFLSELAAVISANEQVLTPTNVEKIKQIVNSIAKKMGLPAIFSAADGRKEVLDFMNTVSKGLRTGTDLKIETTVDTSKLSTKKRKVGAFDVEYFEDSEEFKGLTNSGLVENNYDLNNISGEVVAIHQPDNMLVGTIKHKGKEVFKGMGGVFYTPNTGNVWASGAESSAKSLVNLINKSLKESTDGVGRLVLVRGTDSKMISSTEGVKAAMSIVELLVDKGLISRSDFRSSLIRAGKQFNIDFSGKDSSSAIHKDIKDKFMDVKNSTFQRRGDFFDAVINDLATTSTSAKDNIDKIRTELGSKRKISFSKDGIRDSIGEILTERLLSGLPNSHVYAVIEVTSPVTYKERKGHDSYPWIIVSESKPKLKLLSDRGHAVKGDVFEMIDGSEVSQAKLGLAQRGMGMAKISSRKKQLLPTKVSEKLTEDNNGNYVFHHYSSEKRDKIKPTAGEGSLITTKEEASALSSVGGVAQYYTQANQAEPGTGAVLHTVLVPMDKVYDLQSDVNNYYDEAKARFNEVRPGQAFGPNYQAAWIGKIANENGYDMLVSNWRGDQLRAQTTLELTPEKENVPMKDQKKAEYNVGDDIIVYGSEAKITDVNGSIVSFEGGGTSGSINVDRNKLSIRKKRKTEDKNLGKKVDKSFRRPVEKKTVNEYTALKDQLKLEAKAARKADMNIKQKQRALAEVVKDMARSGKITSQQAVILIKRIAYLNMDNNTMVSKFIDYAGKVFERADYQARISEANSLRKNIKSKLKKDRQAETVAMAKDFTGIDPSTIEDIDQYIEMAEVVLEAMKGSTTRGIDVIIKEAANIKEVSDYTQGALLEQENYLKEEIKSMYKDLVADGIINDDMSLSEMKELIDGLGEDPNKMLKSEQEKYIKDYIQGVIDTYASMVNHMVDTDTDPFTGEQLGLTSDQKSIAKRMIKVDLGQIDVKIALKIVDALSNFTTNQVTSSMEGILSNYDGVVNAKKIADTGFKSKSLGFLGGKVNITDKVSIGRFWSQQFATIKTLSDTLFGGVNAASRVLRDMGFSAFEAGVAKATKMWNSITDEYSAEFKNAKPNGEVFNSANNIYERGMYAFLSRTVQGDPKQQQAELERRIGLIKQSIDVITEEAPASDKHIADVYQQIFERLGLDQEGVTITDIESRVDPINRKAVQWWVDQWSNHYSDLSDVSLSVYNTQLGKDMNYTPDKFSKVRTARDDEDMILEKVGGAFAGSLDYVYDKKTGVLMESTRTTRMAPGRFINLDFDTNNASALKSALVDINTAASTRQIAGFLSSDGIKKIIPNAEDRDIFSSRIRSYVVRSRNKMPIANDQISAVERFSRLYATLGTAKALGGVTQAVKQTVPVMLNTIVNAGKHFNPGIMANPDARAFVNRSGRAIASRGIESQSNIETVNKVMDKVANSKLSTAIDTIEKVNTFWLKTFLAKPDVWIARSAWIAYYKQDLASQGLPTDIDFATAEINDQAADYAQHMVDRQQNISDTNLAGEFMAAEDPWKKITRNILMPFISFSLNQKSRMYSDVMAITSSTTSKEDRVIALRSLSGLSVEMLTYNAMGAVIKYYMITALADLVMGDDDEMSEEEKEKEIKKAKQNLASQVIRDILSPVPATDEFIVGVADKIAEWGGSPDKSTVDKAVADKNESLLLKGKEPMDAKAEASFRDTFLEENRFKLSTYESDNNYGSFGIVYGKYEELEKLAKAAYGGEVEVEFNKKTSTKYLSEEDRKPAQTMVPLMTAYMLGLLPAETSAVTRMVMKKTTKKAMTENQYEKMNSVKKDLGKKDLSIHELYLIRSNRKIDGVKEEIEWIDRFGGLDTKEKQQKYVDLMEKQGEVSYPDLKNIQEGK